MLFKRLSLSLLVVAMVSLLVSGASYALFTATTTNAGNTFTAGTVSLDSPNDMLVDIAPIAPGDTGSAGTYAVTYTGNLAAWIGLDASVSGDLVSCDGGKFDVMINDGTTTHTLNNTTSSIVGAVVGSAPVSSGATINLSVSYDLDISAGNDCQGDDATLSLLVKAVQSANNTNGTNDGPISWS